MGQLVNGDWRDQWYDTKATGGRFQREDAAFRNWVTADGGPGPTGQGGFKAAAGRYHLYVAAACPWAHRALIFRALKGLEDMVPVTVVEPLMLENGWEIAPGADPILGARYLHQVYTAAKSDYTGRVTVPVLWDKQTQTIVSNESADIIRMFNSAFDGVGARRGDYYPDDLRHEIDLVNERVYRTVNNGVYRAGFATTQAAYDEAVTDLFHSLDWLALRKPTGGCSPRCCASMRSMSATSSATSAASPITPTCPASCVSFTNGRASRGPSICPRSRPTTTAAIRPSTPRGSSPPAPIRTWTRPTGATA